MKVLAILVIALPVAVGAATITVDATLDNTTAADGHCTLREAFANVSGAADTTSGDCVAGSGAGDTIAFAWSSDATINLVPDLGPLVLTKSAVINAPAGRTLRIDGRHLTSLM